MPFLRLHAGLIPFGALHKGAKNGRVKVLHMSKDKKRDPVKVMLRVTIVLVVIAVAAVVLNQVIGTYRSNLLAQQQEEARQINAQRDTEYAVALAEFEAASQSGANLAWPTQKAEGWDVLDLTTYPLENPYTVTVTRQDIMNNGMLLVNQWHSRPEDFSEAGLVGIAGYVGWDNLAFGVPGSASQLFPAAIDALQACLTDAKEIGLTDYTVLEGYRSMEEQTRLFQEKMDSLSSRYTGDALVARTMQDVNYPGTGEYQTGLSFRLRIYKRGDDTVNNQAFSTSQQGIWLAENSWRYGIVFRFPLTDYPLPYTTDKSYKTGISSQLNLYRYVGRGNAAVMHTLDLCLEEYVEYLMEHPHIAVFEDGTLRYEIFRQVVGDADSITLQLTGKTATYDSSLDNMGGVITVFSY